MALVQHLFLSLLVLLMVLHSLAASYAPQKSQEAGKLPALVQPFMGWGGSSRQCFSEGFFCVSTLLLRDSQGFISPPGVLHIVLEEC